jgi:predicted dehydrogenase
MEQRMLDALGFFSNLPFQISNAFLLGPEGQIKKPGPFSFCDSSWRRIYFAASMTARAKNARPIRIGIIGAGGIVRSRHLPGLRKIPGVQITAVANSSVASAAAFCKEFSLDAHVHQDWRDLVDDLNVDCVWIGATPHLHEPCTIAALENGHHVFCQARMASTLAAAGRMLDASLQYPGRVTMLCPPPFGLSEDAWVRKCLAAGRIGTPLFLRLRSLNGAFLDPSTPAHWRQREEISGQNIMTLGIFTEVLQRWFGPVASVSATGRVVVPVRQGYIIRIPDILQVHANFGNGLLSSWEFSGMHAGPAVNDLEICGENGLLHFDFDTGILKEKLRGKSDWTTLACPKKMLRPWRVEADFIDAVKNPSAPRPRPDFLDGISYMRVVDAVHTSLSTGRQVTTAPGVA